MENQNFNSFRHSRLPLYDIKDLEIRELRARCKMLEETIKWQGGVDDHKPVVDNFLRYMKEVNDG